MPEALISLLPSSSVLSYPGTIYYMVISARLVPNKIVIVILIKKVRPTPSWCGEFMFVITDSDVRGTKRSR